MLKAGKLGKDSRLTTNENFRKIFKKAKKFQHLGISVLVQENQQTASRLGVSLSKAQIPRAVDRNKIRRIIRESFRVNRNNLTTSLDMVFLAYSTVLGLSNDEIRVCLNFIWAKLISYYNKA